MAWDRVNFAQNIPERKIDAGDSCRSHDPVSVPKVLSPHHLPKVFDAGWILAQEQLLEVFDGSYNAAGMPFEGGFAPSKEPWLIGQDFYKNPVPHSSVTYQSFDGRDLHDGLQS